ncbi:threonine/serine exporter family protein [Tepidibacillus sp. HK-1]|uniref:threonine/serine exporter family protein n=1 Tax=Tepidibacillus sp. HK-1 TaxID=1883407 RepID=UPI0008531FB3|nr:threonine/serine exporter family protein [Tepidibacillus sp. HK-1]
MEVCLLAGKIMLSSGAETYRVEDTMNRIAKAYSVYETNSYVTPTGIFLTIQGRNKEDVQTKFMRISERLIDLNKVALVNDISRKISSGIMSIDLAYEKLLEVEKEEPLYPFWLQILAASVASAFFSLMFGGGWQDVTPALFAGGIGFILFIYIHRIVQVKFFAEILAAFIIGAIAYLFYYFGMDIHLDKVIIGSIMPLVPGVLITNAVRDLMAGDLVSGLARGAEAFFTAFAIGAGIAVFIAMI